VPYRTTADLPPETRNLPAHAKEIFLAAFNNAWGDHADRGPTAPEEIAFRIAWAAAKQRYRKRGGRWVAND
jgi:cation transport regulator